MITSAAVKITLLNGEEKIIPCHRHGDCYEILAMFGIQRDKTKDVQGFIKWIPDKDDPFYSGNEEFVNRIDAYKHAIECGQLFDPFNEQGREIRELYSEDLW